MTTTTGTPPLSLPLGDGDPGAEVGAGSGTMAVPELTATI